LLSTLVLVATLAHDFVTSAATVGQLGATVGIAAGVVLSSLLSMLISDVEDPSKCAILIYVKGI